ncbi:MAG: DUF433 domain-containing protein [Anaerolineae bacterium]|nr:DUF433 domain-containing protein [Anaerolineae bacterium]
MTRYPLYLPEKLKRHAQETARRQGISLNQFILKAVADRVAELSGEAADTRFPLISYRLGASGIPTPVVSGTGVRVQTLHLAVTHWGRSPAEVAESYGFLTAEQVEQALAFAQAHRQEIEAAIAEEVELETAACPD